MAQQAAKKAEGLDPMILAAVGGGIVVVVLVIIIIVILAKKKSQPQNQRQKRQSEKFASELNDQQRDEETPAPQNVTNNESKDLRQFDSNATAQGLTAVESHNERDTRAAHVEPTPELNSFRASE